MRLLPAKDVQTNPLEGEPPRCQVTISGGAPVSLAGRSVLAALALGPNGPVPGGHLILTEDDVLFEEMLHVQLIDAGGEVLERVSIGGAYETGALENLRVMSRDTVAFRCIMDWQVKVLDAPQWRLPVPQRGIWRYNRLRSWLRVEEVG